MTASRSRVLVLGSTGSIGTQALDVISLLSDQFEVVGLAASSSADLIASQAHSLGVSSVALADPAAADAVSRALPGACVGAGADAVVELIHRTEPDIVLNALVGSAGLRATVETLRANRRLALANKESLVVGGDIVMPLLAAHAPSGAEMLPVDSEHSAIFQCLVGERGEDVAKIWLTASGGPFYGHDRAFLATVTRAQALAHPTWKMGPKITVDSSTLMNKGLEVIEAHHLFSVSYDHIQVVVHPQSTIHSMVEYSDGSVKAHLGVTDMRIPIEYAFTYPDRGPAPATPVDFRSLGSLSFGAPDLDTFGCLDLAFSAGRAGGSAPVVLNAANEVAVAWFLGDRCGLLDIEGTVEAVLSDHQAVRLESLEQIEEIDRAARESAERILVRTAGGA